LQGWESQVFDQPQHHGLYLYRGIGAIIQSKAKTRSARPMLKPGVLACETTDITAFPALTIIFRVFSPENACQAPKTPNPLPTSNIRLAH
jgi:hypothetical protein